MAFNFLGDGCGTPSILNWEVELFGEHPPRTMTDRPPAEARGLKTHFFTDEGVVPAWMG